MSQPDAVATFIARRAHASAAERVDPDALNAPDHALGATRATPEPITAKDKTIHYAALVSTLKQLHDELDAAVAAAYGWPWPLSDAEILERVVALNTQRAQEEAAGHIRWLRPEYQIPLLAPATQTALGLADGVPVGAGLPRDSSGKPKLKASRLKPKAPAKSVWPKTIPERAKAVEAGLAAAEESLSVADLSAHFTRAKPDDVAEILATLVALSRAHESDTKGKYVR